MPGTHAPALDRPVTHCDQCTTLSSLAPPDLDRSREAGTKGTFSGSITQWENAADGCTLLATTCPVCTVKLQSATVYFTLNLLATSFATSFATVFSYLLSSASLLQLFATSIVSQRYLAYGTFHAPRALGTLYHASQLP